MSVDELVTRLEQIRESEDWGDWEVTHAKADSLLLQYINDERVTALHAEMAKWYA